MAYCIDLNALGVSLDEVEAALTLERRPGVRKRLAAIAGVLAGMSIEQAAHAAQTSHGTVKRSLNRVSQGGLQALVHDRRSRQPQWRMTARRREATRRDIAAALARPLMPHVRSRLIAIDMVLAGRPIEEAAASAGVQRSTTVQWLRIVARDGIAPTLHRWENPRPPRPCMLAADPAALRELAAKETNRPRRKQMLALALVAEGMSPHAAAISVATGYEAVLRRLRRFQKEGMAAFDDQQRSGRAKKLNAAQIQELRAELLERTAMDFGQLCAFIATRFGVSYSREGLRLLLRRELGYVWSGQRFTAATAPRFGEGLQPRLDRAALQGALDHTTDARLKQRLIPLIQLAQGWKPDRVAAQAGVALERVEKWLGLYQDFGIDALRPRPRTGPRYEIAPEARDALAAWISADPKIGDAALCARLKTHFGIKHPRLAVAWFAAEIRAALAPPANPIAT